MRTKNRICVTGNLHDYTKRLTTIMVGMVWSVWFGKVGWFGLVGTLTDVVLYFLQYNREKIITQKSSPFKFALVTEAERGSKTLNVRQGQVRFWDGIGKFFV